MNRTWKIAGINFDHMHMGDLLRMAHDHPNAEIAAICDAQPARMKDAIANFGIPRERVFTDVRRCLEQSRPDLVIPCPATAECPEGVEVPADALEHPFHNPVAYVLDCLECGRPIDGPLSPAIARSGQQLVDSAVLSAARGASVTQQQ